jgi:hypothetical protein
MSRGLIINFTTTSITSAFLPHPLPTGRFGIIPALQHSLSRAQIPPRVLALAGPDPRTTQGRCTASGDRQVDPTMHPAGRRKSPRARRRIQRAPAIRRPRLRTHHHRHQQVRPSFPPCTLTHTRTLVHLDRRSSGARSRRSLRTTAHASSPSTSTQSRNTPNGPRHPQAQGKVRAVHSTRTMSCARRRPSSTSRVALLSRTSSSRPCRARRTRSRPPG